VARPQDWRCQQSLTRRSNRAYVTVAALGTYSDDSLPRPASCSGPACRAG
jgi:hypothetical protein